MSDRWIDTASAVVGVFLVMAVGGLSRHWKWLSPEVDRSLASLTSYVLMPCLFFHRIITDASLSADLDAWYPAVLGTFAPFLGSGWLGGQQGPLAVALGLRRIRSKGPLD